MALALLLAAAPLAVQSAPAAVLRCRLGAGAWQPCRMALDADGLGWSLQLEGGTVRFRHDGRGTVRMEQPPSHWHPVQARWLADAALCWNGICAQGDIPLD